LLAYSTTAFAEEGSFPLRVLSFSCFDPFGRVGLVASRLQFPFADLLRQSIYSRLAGHEDLNDAERLSQDPTIRLIGSEKARDRGADRD
jgi:hypothetical protein